MDTKEAGAKGGRATAANRTREERSAAMRHAGLMRWAKWRKEQKKTKAERRKTR